MVFLDGNLQSGTANIRRASRILYNHTFSHIQLNYTNGGTFYGPFTKINGRVNIIIVWSLITQSFSSLLLMHVVVAKYFAKQGDFVVARVVQ